MRRHNLRLWFAARAIPAKEKSYLSQLMTGVASFGERAARRLEKDYGMGAGFLDTPAANSDPAELAASDAEEQVDDQGATLASDTGMLLAWVTMDEMRIISDYRAATEVGRSLIRTSSRTVKKKLAEPG